MKKFLLVLLFASVGTRWLVGDDHNPIGVTGAFEGVITTGSAYNVLNHNATRQIDDIVVPGAIGKYPLKMTRYYNSRFTFGYGILGPGWTHEYLWTSGNDKVRYPNGTVWDSHCTGDWHLDGPLGVSDWPTTWNGSPAFRLADGGTVVFENPNWGVATKIIDPYGQVTTITLDAVSGIITRVTEPGRRYLQFTYTTYNGVQVLNRVDAYDGRGNQIDWVVYHYASKPTGGTIVTTAVCLTSVDYSDGQHATYTYTTDNSPENPSPPCPCPLKLSALVIGCDDARYHSPMRRIAYEYQQGGPHGAILREKYWDGSPGHEANGPMVSRIDPPAPSPLIGDPYFDTRYTEYRGDGPTRTFTYTPLHLGRGPVENSCPVWHSDPTTNPAPQQFLTDYTDFRGNSTHLGYDPNWYVNSVRDANLQTTSYVRGSPPPAGIGEILTITHPGGSHIDYTYYDEGSGSISGHYLQSVTDERGAYLCDPAHTTTYRRDQNYRVNRIEYPHDANTPVSVEEFTYNNFGQVLTHLLKNGAWESFVYDGRGLLTDKYNPKATVPGGGDPHIHYSYYTGVDGKPGWIDRVKTMTLPANGASETYEYDLSANNTSRGLVTKIQHAGGKYQSFFYDAYGNKLWEENELRKRTTYTYDDYNRVLTVKNALNKTETFDYLKPGTTSPYLHTTSSVYTHTSRAAIVTTSVYDQNWRKTSTVVASGTLNLTTGFAYDLVGNLTDVTDPRGKIAHSLYDNRNRKTQTTEASNTPLAVTTVWHYDPASNINQIDRPDSIHETKGFDALNRMIWHSVPRQVPGQQVTIYLRTNYEYDPSGTIHKITDPKGNYTTFAYDDSDRRITMTYRNDQTQQWAYDNAGNLKNRTTVRGGTEIQRFTYDNRNRKTDMSWDNNADWAHFTYYDDSRLHVAQSPNSTVTRQYDAAGHLVWEQQNITRLGSTKTVNYPSYDDDGRLTNVNVGGASYDYTYSYDLAGRFEKIKLTSNGSVQFEYDYDAASNETDRYAYLPNSVSIQQHYFRDSLNRMGSRLVKKNGTTFSTEAYTYDDMNRITEVNRGGVADDFGYYWDGELLSAQYGGGPNMPYTEGQDPDLDTTDNIDPNAGYQPPEQEAPEPTPPPEDYSDLDVAGFVPPMLPGGRSVTYYVDRAGNRQQVTDSASSTATYTANNINQYSSLSGCSITNGPEHEVSDFRGPNDPGQVHYTYINDEHLTTVNDGQNTYNLYYDALGRCVKRALNGTATYYIYDGEKPIVEYNSSNTIIARNVYGKAIDEILMRKETGINDGNWFYYADDHEGSVTHLLDGRSTPSSQTGEVIERYRYDVFGAPTFYDGSWTQLNSTAYNNRFLFTGREYAATYRGNYVQAFTFYEYRARAYNPILGRFMSEDPKLFDAGDYNLFRYCHNDPIDFTDPMGLEVGFAESLIPVWGSAHMAYEAYNEAHYGLAAFHTAMAITDVSGVKALGSLAVKASFKSLAKTELGRAIAKTTEHKAATTGYRYVGKAEANAIRETGRIPVVDASGKAKNVFFTNEKFALGSEAKEGLSLTNKPQYRVEFNLNQAPAGYGGLTEAKRAEFTLREGAQPIKAERIVPLDDAELLNETSRHTPPKLDK